MGDKRKTAKKNGIKVNALRLTKDRTPQRAMTAHILTGLSI